MQFNSEGIQRPSSKTVSQASWNGYVQNVGVYVGSRAICDGRGTVLADVPTRVHAQRFRAGEGPGDEFLLWDTAVRTGDGVEHAQEEWSRDELAEFAALAADGSYSVGPNLYAGEQFTVEQCLCDGPLRVRSIHAFDWEGRQCGIIASRERRMDDPREAPPTSSSSLSNDTAKSTALVVDDLQFYVSSPGIEPAAWRSPTVLLDYMMGVWQGKGILLDRASGSTRRVSSKVTLQRTDGLGIAQTSSLAIDGAGPGTTVNSRARQDGNVVFFPESGVQVALLPGGMSLASPFRVSEGRPFVIETTFLMKPDCRKRVVRCYNMENEWVNTVFLSEKRVG